MSEQQAKYGKNQTIKPSAEEDFINAMACFADGPLYLRTAIEKFQEESPSLFLVGLQGFLEKHEELEKEYQDLFINFAKQKGIKL
ncbi:MAG TPA: hypothetical protein ENL09_02445 [Bacteroidetes bacterium]|nr:hypothetical protein [Bacteroidota bacterium]